METSFDKNNPEVQQILNACYLDTRVFAKTFFPEDVDADFSILHDDIFNVIDAKHKKKAIAAPRGLGKTTLAKIRVCKAILFREVSFIIYLSNSAGSAEMQTEAIKRMLQSNELVTTMFGDIKFSQEGLKDSFSKQSWVAYGDVFVLPRGAGQQVRGLNWMGNRPGLIVIDDLESTETVQSDDQRDKLKKWFLSDLMKTESRYGDPAQFLYIDTIKHQDALLQMLIDADDWMSIILSICDSEFNTFDSNYMTTEEIKADYESHREKGETDLFYMELMNIPISLEDAIFKPEYFKYFEESGDQIKVVTEHITKSGEIILKEELLEIRNLVTLVICDPAKTVKLHSAESAVVTISIDRETHRIFVRDIFSKKVKPDELYEAMFDAVVRYSALILAVEVTSLHEFISQPIENEMRIRSIFPQYIELNAKGKKEMRIATLAPNYRLGYMYHNKNNCQKLESQLEWFPKSKLFDVMDALAYVTYIMDNHAIYFDPSDGGDPDEDYSELEDYDEELPEDDWRMIA